MKQPSCLLTEECHEMWYIDRGILLIHKKERNSELCYSIGQPKDIMLCEQARHRKTNTVWICLCVLPRIAHFTEAESRLVVVRGWGLGPGDDYHLVDVESVWEELDGSGGGWWWCVHNAANALNARRSIGEVHSSDCPVIEMIEGRFTVKNPSSTEVRWL